jgi:hypothetical protein
MMNSLKPLAARPALLRRALYVVVIVGAIAATATLTALHDRASARVQEAATAQAWKTFSATPANSASPSSAAAAYSRFNVNTAANADLNWQAASAADLRASLRALDDAQVKLTQVKITRSGGNFVVNAERAP